MFVLTNVHHVAVPFLVATDLKIYKAFLSLLQKMKLDLDFLFALEVRIIA
jgi:hypothetical protein